jgi:hypothetical protein
MDTKILQDFSIKLMELIPLDEENKKFLKKDKIMFELFSLIRTFTKEYSEADINDGLELYTIFHEDVFDILTLGNSLKNDSLSEKLEETLKEFMNENGLEK